MWPNPQFPADLVTFTEKKSLMKNFIFCAVIINEIIQRFMIIAIKIILSLI